MFTGIIETLSEATQLPSRSSPVLEAKLESEIWSALTLGESVAINGVCLTVASLPRPGAVTFFVSPETLDRTALGGLASGNHPSAALIHIERAMPAQGRFSGHWVQGHVDGLAIWKGATSGGGAWQARFQLPSELLKYCVVKGSIALDGVSLTINRVHDDSREIEITLVPHTWNLTRFSALTPGDHVNVEVDVIAKYVERLTSRGDS